MSSGSYILDAPIDETMRQEKWNQLSIAGMKYVKANYSIE